MLKKTFILENKYLNYFFIIIPIIYIVYNFITTLKFPKKNLLFIENLNLISIEFLNSHQQLLHFSLILLIFTVIFGKIDSIKLFFITIISFFLFEFRLIDEHLNSILETNNLYLKIFSHNNINVNPQYPKLILLLTFYLILTLQLIKKRTMDRCFIFLGIGAILITIFLFHNVIPKNTLQFHKDLILYDIKNYYKENEDNFDQVKCLKKYTCYNIKNIDDFYLKLNDYKFSKEKVNILIKNDIYEDASIISYFDKSGRFNIVSFYYVINNKKSDYFAHIIVEREKTIYIQQLSEIQFSYLAIYANAFWLLFSLSLIYLHKKNWRFKIFYKK